ncbi:MAG TPA: PGPGW domain-containing protein [Candidatus Polarisedimenticolia bacterium]|nr:PGPGW domain-containing protein [Candidatus Polarisedimenticolia bacterium]
METATGKNVLTRMRHALRLDWLAPGVRRIAVGIMGGTILLIGLALIFLPGPAFLVIPLGLAILATEFAWARHYLQKARGLIRRKNKSGNK